MPRKYWSVEEISRLEKTFPNCSLSDLVEQFSNRSLSSLRHKAVRLGIKRQIADWVKHINPLHLSDFGLGFIVGMLEGEGSVTLYHSKKRPIPTPRVFWVNTNWELLAEIKRLLNDWGVIYEHNKIPHGNDQQSYVYLLTRYGEIEEVLRTLEPYLIGKKRQAQLVLEFLESRRREVRRPVHEDGQLIGTKSFLVSERNKEILVELSSLNTRGVLLN